MRTHHASPTEVALWLPVRRRVEFKLACLVHQSLAAQTPSYLASDIQLTVDTGRPQLRSASERIMCSFTHTTASATEAFLLPAPSGVERLAITSAAGHTDISSMY